MYCKYLKLSNGEDIMVTTDDDCRTFVGKEFLTIVDPVLITTYKYPEGDVVIERYILQPWIRMARQDAINIPTKSIVLAVDVKESTLSQYKQFVEECVSLEPLIEERMISGNNLTEILENEVTEEDEYYEPTPTKPNGFIH